VTNPTIVVLHHGRWIPLLEDAVKALSEEHGIVHVEQAVIDTAQFSGAGDSVSWNAAHTEVWRRVGELRDQISRRPASRVAYFGGGPEIPLTIAFGAYMGEHQAIELYELHDGGNWTWPEKSLTLDLEVLGEPQDRQSTAGPATLCIELSARIEEPLVREFVVETDEVAHVLIRPRDQNPEVRTRIRSRLDLEAVRSNVRSALTAIVNKRPNVTAIHLFVAAPASACVLIGQELRLRNMPSVETYRFRRTDAGEPNYVHAIRLREAGPTPREITLTDAERVTAGVLRKSVWEAALREVEEYAQQKKRSRTDGELWFDRIVLSDLLRQVRPFPALPPIYDVLPDLSTVDPVPLEGAFYGYERNTQKWRVNDRFLLELSGAYGGDVNIIRQLVRLFMFHEALHVAHGITKAKVDEVGKFPNALEHVDYTADLYALLHELDRSGPLPVVDDPTSHRALKDQVAALIDLVVRSFWAFELNAPEPLHEIEIRRIRRYLNWYWQLERVLMSKNRLQLARVLARKPIIEIAGLDLHAESRRVYGSLQRFDKRVGLELAVVLDDEELRRVPSSVTVPITELVADFRTRDHQQIKVFFRRLFDEIGDKHALPPDR
jgi:hypothetical protein